MSLEEFKAKEFEKLTENFKKALEDIRKNPDIPAIQESIINLTGCSRRLLSTPKRKWVMDGLDDIKKERLHKFAEADNFGAVGTSTEIDALTELIEKQNKRIETLQAENGELFDKVLRLESENRTLNTENAELKQNPS